MKDFVKSLGGAGWAAFLGLSAVATVAVSFGLPNFVDTTNPWVLLGAGAILFLVAFANGWKQRGFRNERDIRLADELEKSRKTEEAKSAVEIARIEAEKDIEIERMSYEREEAKEAEQVRMESEKADRERRDRIRFVRGLPDAQKAVVAEALAEGGTVVRHSNDPIGYALAESGVFVALEIEHAFQRYWKVSDDVRDLIVRYNIGSELDDARARFDDAEKRKRWGNYARIFSEIEDRAKSIVCTAYKRGRFRCGNREPDLYEINGFVNVRQLGNSAEVKLRPDLRDFFDNNQGLLENVPMADDGSGCGV